MTLGFWLQKDVKQIFNMRYYTFILIKGLQKYQRSQLKVENKSASWALGVGVSTLNFFQPLTLTPDIFPASYPK